MAEKKEKRYVSDNAQLMAEWDWEKNNELGFEPNKLTCGSDKKAWWMCGKGHEWQATVGSRNNGAGCPFCSGRMPIKGCTDIQTVNPSLIEEWDYEKNDKFSPDNILPNSHAKVWWKCRNEHEWQATLANRIKGRGCPYCAGRYAIAGKTDLQTANPSLANEWNYARNISLTPSDVLPNSHQNAWWLCSNGHEWQARIDSRNKGAGCPYCAGRYAIAGKTDLQTLNPLLAKEWNYEKNMGLFPENMMPNSEEKVWWICGKGHEWQAKIKDRNNGNGCPICSGKMVLKGFNDLRTVNPSLAQEWNFEKNKEITPEDVTSGSSEKAWWICSKGHEWQATIASRNIGIRCPVCTSERHTSFPEYAFVYYLKKCGMETIHSYKENGYELDIYIPSKKIAIEYDGYYWHKEKAKKDLEKNRKCEKDGITLYRVREGLPLLNDTSIDCMVQKDQQDLDQAIKMILTAIIGTTIEVDLRRDSIDIENLRIYTEKKNSLLLLNPQVAKDWNYEKNGNLRPENVTANSDKKAWWKCDKGHEWQASVSSRNQGAGCPYCSGRCAIKGENDLQIVNPTLAEEWNYKMNGALTPSDVLPTSNKKAWWKCNCGHEWEAIIANRKKGHGCPECARQKRKKKGT